VVLWVYCCEDPAEAERGAREFLPQFSDSSIRHYELKSDHLAKIKGYEHYGQRALEFIQGARNESEMEDYYVKDHIWGTPEQCIQKIERMRDLLPCGELIFHMKWGTMTAEQAERSVRLFAKEVLPAVHEMPSVEQVAV
jgi:alkanesulfonate monooxygenase SsuD/methylene tetrahydromethanopterin reductase-like flavin-dependent oxidoreductase (luciferase family)